MTAGAAVGSLALLVLAGARGAFTVYLAWAAIGACQAAVLYEPAFAAIASWFPTERDRLRALLVVTIVGGFASTLFGPLIAGAIGALGWRVTTLCMAALALVVVLPLHASLPEGERLPPRSSRGADDVRVLSLVFAAHAFVSAGVAVHLVAHLIERGATLHDAAVLAGVLGVAQVGGRLFASSLRAWSASTRGLLLFGAQAVALIALGNGGALPGIVLFGAANGLLTIERAMIVTERFGRERYGENSGRIARVGLIARAGAPLAVGWARVHVGPRAAFSALAVLLGLAALTLQLELAQRQPAR
jgi:MFS family permease